MCKSISKYTPGSEMWGLRAFPSFLILHNCSTILKKTFLSLKKKKKTMTIMEHLQYASMKQETRETKISAVFDLIY